MLRSPHTQRGGGAGGLCKATRWSSEYYTTRARGCGSCEDPPRYDDAVPTQDPTDADVMAAWVRAGIARIHTCIPAIVIVYDPTTQKCDVQPVIRPRIDDPLLDIERATLTPLAPIPNLPVAWQSSGQAAQTFGLLPGDPVTVWIAERSTDEWRTGGLTDNIPLDARRFDLSDGIVYPGGRTFNPAAGPTAPLVVGVDIDAAGAHVIGSTLPVAGVKLGSAAAIQSAMLGDLFETDLSVFMAALNIYITALSVLPAGPLTPIQLLALTFLPSVVAFEAQVNSGVHRSLKVKVDL